MDLNHIKSLAIAVRSNGPRPAQHGWASLGDLVSLFVSNPTASPCGQLSPKRAQVLTYGVTVPASARSGTYRLPHELHDMIKAAADAAGRSVNAEIVARLQGSFERDEAYWLRLIEEGCKRALASEV